jgi:hypothetical protein
MKKITILFTIFLLPLSLLRAQLISTVAGNGTQGFFGDGGQATAGEINWVYGIAIDGTGNMYLADQANCRVRKVNTNGVITTFAGTGAFGFSGDGGQATAAQMGDVGGVSVDPAGTVVYIGDLNNARVRMVTVATGIIKTVAGNGMGGFSGDGGQATAAEVSSNYGVWIDQTGTNFYIGDYGNQRVRKVVVATGIIKTVAGNGTGGFSGDGGQATAAELSGPDQICTDPAGNLFISDYGNNRVRKVNTSGVIITLAGTGVAGYNGDNIQATAAQISGVESVALDASGNVYLADLTERIRKVATTGIITTVAGNGSGGYNGDGIPATTAWLNLPTRVATDFANAVYIGDEFNARIRKIGGTPLPIKLISFNALYSEALNDVQINWATASEIDNKLFTVERSANGEDFSVLTEVAGAGNSSSTKYYYATDPSPTPGIIYYRLKQTDYDGNYVYSDIKSVNIPVVFSVYPNPANHTLNVIPPQANGKTIITLYNVLGVPVLSTSSTNQASIEILVDNLPKGIYLLKAQTDNGSAMVKKVEILR